MSEIKQISRREFIQAGVKGVIGITVLPMFAGCRPEQTTPTVEPNPEATEIAKLTDQISALGTAVANKDVQKKEQESTFQALTIMCGEDGNQIEIKHLSGNTCGVNAQCSWKVPGGASVDYNGLKLAQGETVGPGSATLHDCSLSNNIIGYNPDSKETSNTKQEEEKLACNEQMFIDLPVVQELIVQSTENGQAQVHFDEKGTFVVPKGWDLDFYGNKFTQGSIVEVKEGDSGTLWAPQECKPLDW